MLAAASMMGPPEYQDVEAYFAAFLATWGSYDLSSLHRAFETGNEFNRLFAIWALGSTRSETAQTTLRPLLFSDQPLERWASAIALAENYHDTRALPILWHMLTEMLPPCPDTHSIAVLDRKFSASEYYFGWRREVPSLLGAWREASSVPALRKALQAALAIELAWDNLRGQVDAETDRTLGTRGDWNEFESDIVYALGQLGGFGALAGIEGSEAPIYSSSGVRNVQPLPSHLDHWRIHLTLGSLHGQYQLPWPIVWQWTQTPELFQAVVQRLEYVFGIQPEDFRPQMDYYASHMGATIANMDGWRNNEAPSDNQR